MCPDLSLCDLRALLLSRQPGDLERASDAIALLLQHTPEIGVGVELPSVKGEIRYDSHAHSDDALRALPRATRQRVLFAIQQHPERRVVITQTAPWPNDSHEARLNLIAALSGLQLVEPTTG